MERSLSEHSRLLDVLRGGNPDEARKAFRNHIMNARDRIAKS